MTTNPSTDGTRSNGHLFAAKSREDDERNNQLLGLSKRTLSLTEEIHTHAGAGKSTGSASTGATGP
jgi:hypothetical protein